MDPAAFRALFETTDMGIIFQDAGGTIVDANPAAERILGLTLDMMRGVTPVDRRWRAIRPDGSPFPSEEHPEMVTLSTGERVRGAIMGVQVQTGRDVTWIEIDSVPIRDTAGSIQLVVTTFKDVTSERAAATLHVDQVRRLQDYFDSQAHGILFTSATGVILDANTTLCHMLGHGREELAGRKWQDFAHPEELARDRESYGAFFADDKAPYVRERRFLAKDGTFHWLAVTLSAVRDHSGTQLHVAWTLQDLKVQKELESSLIASQERFQTLFEDVPVAVWDVDLSEVRRAVARMHDEGVSDLWPHLTAHLDEAARLAQLIRVIRVNRDAWALANMPQGSAALPRFRDVMGDRSVRVFTDVVASLDAGAARFEEEVGFRDVSGAERLLMVRVSLPRGREHTWEPVIVTCEDLSARARLEDELRRFKKLDDDAQHGRVLTDEHLRVLYVNRHHATSLGTTPDRMLGLPITDFWAQPATAAEITGALERRGTWTREMVLQRGEGGAGFPADVIATAVRDVAGKLQYAGFTFHDASQRLVLENQLREAQKMEAVGQLAGGIAHDFNNLLQAIVGYTELARISVEGGRGCATEFGQIMLAAERAKNLVAQLLAFGRRRALQPELAALETLVAADLDIIRRMIGEQVVVDWRPGPEPHPVRIDPSTFMQVLMNLCINARDAMPSGGTVTIATRGVELGEQECQGYDWLRPGRFVRLSVSDTGSGIPASLLDQIFLPFFTTKGFGKGTGLGLSTVYGLVRQHEGIVRVSSVEGHGTTFEIDLPLTNGPLQVRAAPAQTSTTDLPRGTETVLLAEDEEPVRVLACRVLEGAGYRVIAAEDGREAIRLFEQRPDDFDLALLDVIMPHAGGRMVHDAIIAHRPELPVLFSSGYTGEPTDSLPGGDRAPRLLAKPYGPVELLHRVREALDAAKAPGGGPSKA